MAFRNDFAFSFSQTEKMIRLISVVHCSKMALWHLSRNIPYYKKLLQVLLRLHPQILKSILDFYKQNRYSQENSADTYPISHLLRKKRRKFFPFIQVVIPQHILLPDRLPAVGNHL